MPNIYKGKHFTPFNIILSDIVFIILVSILTYFRSSSSKIKTCNLEELMSNCSLMYVSGDSQGLDPTKLQLEFCTVS